VPNSIRLSSHAPLGLRSQNAALHRLRQAYAVVRTIDAHDHMYELRMYQCPRSGNTSTVEMPRKLETHPEW
jgi:hypothetical protein